MNIRQSAWLSGARLVMAVVAAVLVGVDLGVKALIEQRLGDGRTLDVGILDLRLGYNTGAAFSVGSDLPGWLVLAVTAAVTVVVAGFAWVTAGRARTSGWLVAGLAAVVGGAVGNLVDRAGDGRVTDYLHTGWFPTFNLADVFITCGAVVFAASTVLNPDIEDTAATKARPMTTDQR